MARIRATFKTEAEARAYTEGIQYVNDSSVTVLKVHKVRGQWEVVIEDDDV